MDFLPLMVRPLSVDTPLFHINSHRQASEILWLTVVVVVILCRLVLRTTTLRQRPLRVLDPFHMLVAMLHRRTHLCARSRCGRLDWPWPMGLGALRDSE